ncbi:MAG: hypothetical protein A2Z16_16395 [Chloroflexi bacterium RBG_16_54_18]|nr:MAG: hypothetical protein A2Z16_16395 [Chloroflexi bacterium RBG_16_54_18]
MPAQARARRRHSSFWQTKSARFNAQVWESNVTKTRQTGLKVKKRIDWSRLLSDLFILAGVLVLFSTTLFWVRSAMAAQQVGYQPYLLSSIDFALPLPSVTPQLPATLAPGGDVQMPGQATPSPEPATSLGLGTETVGIPPAEEIIPSETPADALPTASEAFQPTLPATPDPAAPIPSEPAPTDQMYPPPADPAAPAETEVPPAPAPSAGPVSQLMIHRLQINRAVAPVELRRDGNGSLDWNTDPLFSTPNRSDLVGQLAVSANPGEGGNIILVGHNYNNGWYNVEGVFVRLQNMQVGDEIILFTQNGGEFHYIVEKVKKVPWQKRNLVELERHQKFLWPTDHEQLTLVTCGGVNLWSWQARIYVVALPITPPSP